MALLTVDQVQMVYMDGAADDGIWLLVCGVTN
jgi:hypothetical protein